MTNVKVKKTPKVRISQGDIIRDVEYIEYVVEKSGIIEVSKIIFPFVVVLTQDCDLEQDPAYRNRRLPRPSTQDKKLFSILVAPLYNAEHVFAGEHLLDLNLTMTRINRKKTEGRTLMQNERPRYHYIEFPEDVTIVPSIIDFKHSFSVNIEYLASHKAKCFVFRLSELYREDLSQHFAMYLARIGLPELSSRCPAALSPNP